MTLIRKVLLYESFKIAESQVETEVYEANFKAINLSMKAGFICLDFYDLYLARDPFNL
jgi:hypothetical protein